MNDCPRTPRFFSFFNKIACFLLRKMTFAEKNECRKKHLEFVQNSQFAKKCFFAKKSRKWGENVKFDLTKHFQIRKNRQNIRFLCQIKFTKVGVKFRKRRWRCKLKFAFCFSDFKKCFFWKSLRAFPSF